MQKVFCRKAKRNPVILNTFDKQNLVTQGFNTQLFNVPQKTSGKLQETIHQIVNKGCKWLICVILWLNIKNKCAILKTVKK